MVERARLLNEGAPCIHIFRNCALIMDRTPEERIAPGKISYRIYQQIAASQHSGHIQIELAMTVEVFR